MILNEEEYLAWQELANKLQLEQEVEHKELVTMRKKPIRADIHC